MGRHGIPMFCKSKKNQSKTRYAGQTKVHLDLVFIKPQKGVLIGSKSVMILEYICLTYKQVRLTPIHKVRVCVVQGSILDTGGIFFSVDWF